METIILAEVVEKGMGALLTFLIADRREFIKISQAVGVGFLVMGAVGYIVKLSKLLFRSCAFVGLFLSRTARLLLPLSLLAFLSALFVNIFTPVHIPVNNILVGGA